MAGEAGTGDRAESLGLPPWGRRVLRCPTCGGGPLDDKGGAAAVCGACGHRAPIASGVVDLLVDAHPAVQREADAVAALDRGEARLLVRGHATTAKDGAPHAKQATRRHIEFTLRQIDELLARHPLSAGAVLVELGADACQATPRFLAAGARVVAVDITDHLAHASVEGAGDRLIRVRADMNRLPVHDNAVDIVWATAAAHHSWDLATTFGEAARVLSPGGRIVLCCEPLPGWLRWLGGHGVRAEERALGINETWIPRRRWLRLARRAGFEARIEIPRLTDREAKQRLAMRGLPGWLVSVVRPVLRRLQVSVHLVGSSASG